MEWTESLKEVLQETAKTLKGASRRRFMAQIVLELGHGGQSKAERELGWNRGTIRKGIYEITSGITQRDNSFVPEVVRTQNGTYQTYSKIFEQLSIAIAKLTLVLKVNASILG